MAASSVREETPAQMKARMAADFELRMGPLWKLWSWAGQSSAKEWSSSNSPQPGNEWSWKGLFGRSSTSDVLILPITPENVSKVGRSFFSRGSFFFSFLQYIVDHFSPAIQPATLLAWCWYSIPREPLTRKQINNLINQCNILDNL